MPSTRVMEAEWMKVAVAVVAAITAFFVVDWLTSGIFLLFNIAITIGVYFLIRRLWI